MMTPSPSQIVRVMSVLSTLCLLNLPAQAKYGGGTGEPNDPYLIYTAEQMNTIGTEPNDWDRHFKLMADLDLEGLRINPIGYWTQTDSEDDIPFAGVFDGNGYTIRNFSYEESRDKYREYVGMLRYACGTEAKIRNLVLANSHIANEVSISHRGGIGPVGLLVGMLRDGTVANCHARDGSLTVSCIAGGLIGRNAYGIVEGCTSSATINGDGDGMGGLLGDNLKGIVYDSHSSGDILGGRHSYEMGGFTGTNDNGYIELCSASGNVSSGGSRIGGFAGSNWGTLLNCMASGTVSGYREVGGLVGGWNVGWILTCCAYGDVVGNNSVGGLVGENINYISHCYARGSVTGNEAVGGLVGNNTFYPILAGEIETCYSTGYVSGKNNVAGLVHRGNDFATTSEDCFWDIQTSGQDSSDGGIGKTMAEMQTAETFLDVGWDFMGETPNGTDDIWWILEGQDYPRLWWEVAEEADGTADKRG